MIKMAILLLFFCGASQLCRAQKKDSVTLEYARVSYLGSKMMVFYEDGSSEDLRKLLNLPSRIYASDSVLSVIFFKISNHLRSKGFELITSAFNQTDFEYIYGKKKVIYSNK